MSPLDHVSEGWTDNPSAPKLSLVLPTTGNERSVRRVIGSLVHHAPPSLLQMAELTVFLNIDSSKRFDFGWLEDFIGELAVRFHSAKVVRTERYHLTAEESALAAVRHAHGEYLWIVGDKRIFLPEGLALVNAFMRQPTAPCAYFNSVWFDSNGYTNGMTSTHMTTAQVRVPFKRFVMSQGLNFMATAMGAWLFERRMLDLQVWRQVINTCGPHFSHVTTLLIGLRDGHVLCHAAFLIQAEAKAYHDGDPSEWVRYAELAGTYRLYAWTFGLIRQLRLLIDNGLYSYADVRRSMCSEGLVLRRQVDEIYFQFLSQLWLGRTVAAERIKPHEFQELMDFLARACPEKAVFHQMLRAFYEGTATDSEKVFSNKWMMLKQACLADYDQLRFGSLIIGQTGSCFVRLHPGGYLVAKVQDNTDFMLGYKLLDPPADSKHWQILPEAEFAAFSSDLVPRTVGELLPPTWPSPSPPSRSYRRATRHFVSLLYRSPLTSLLVARMPLRVKLYLRSILI